jgi:serine-aspartate repeat-containing protein C/D/E
MMHDRHPEAVPTLSKGIGATKMARGWLAGLAFAIAVTLTVGGLIGVGSSSAVAATAGITTNVTVGGEKYGDTPVVKEGDTLTLKIQYGSSVTPGSTVRIDLGANITLKDLPAGNSAVEKVVVDPTDSNAVLITFKDPWPTGINQGVMDLTFTVNQVDKSSAEKITWSLDGQVTGLDVVIKNGGDEFANVQDSVSKSANPNNLNGHVSVKDGKVTVAALIIGEAISYRLQVDTVAAKAGYSIADQLPAGMEYVSGSFGGSQTTWDASGLNKVTNNALEFAPTIAGNAFAGTVNLPASSRTTLTYKATVANEAARAALEAQLQTEYNKIAATGGSYSVKLKNTATFGGNTERTASVSIGGSVAGPSGPNLGNAFNKEAAWASTVLNPAEDGTLNPAADVTYTLKADLREWSGENTLKTLTGNMVVWDTLPSQMKWKTGDASFIVATSDPAGTVAMPLTKATSFSGNAQAFKAEQYVGQYYVDEATQTLFVNVGRDNTQQVKIAAKAQLTTVTGLPVNSTKVPGQRDYTVKNRGNWAWDANGLKQDGFTRESILTSKYEDAEGFNFDSYFNKTTDKPSVELEVGVPADVAYKFTVGAGKGIDITKSSIVDYVDTNVFDISDLSKIQLSGQYDWWRVMENSSFVLKTNDAGNLVITLSEAGVAQIAAWGGANKQFVLTMVLPLKPVDGKQTLQIENKATLFGEDNKALFWSEASSDATTYGDEAEIRKTIRDTPNQQWTQNLRAEVDGDGKLIQNKFVYNVGLIPHGLFDGVKIMDVVDELPAGLKFEGFVTDGNVETGNNPSKSVQDLKGNIQARYEAAEGTDLGGTVTLFQKPNTVLNAKAGVPSVNILVSIVDYSIDEAIVNTIGTTSATVTPTDGYPLSIAKVDSTDLAKVIDDPAARFQILDSEDKVVVDNVFVKDGALRVAGEDGKAKNVKVSKVGTYAVKEITAPKGYARSTETITVVVDADGSSKAVKFANTPAKTYAVGNYVWIDANKNGLQDADEDILEGVKVTLLDGEGKALATTATDSDGRYILDELDAGDYQIKFELTADQQKLYNFTTPNAPAGSNDENDSDTDTETGLTAKFSLDGNNKALTHEYRDELAATEGIDPTWDAGVVLKPRVSVGDFVWVDSNRDGVQSDGEKGIKDVVLTIAGTDGEPVTDVLGNVVGPVTTDENGKYTFENLPVLKDGESYTVNIDREASEEPLAPYVPTIDTGADRGTNSSTWTATSKGLTKDGDRDPTLDFGFVAPKEEPTTPAPTVDPTSPAPTIESSLPADPKDPASTLSAAALEPSVTSTSEKPALSNTGFNGAALMGLGLLLAMLGAGAVIVGSRRSIPRHLAR